MYTEAQTRCYHSYCNIIKIMHYKKKYSEYVISTRILIYTCIRKNNYFKQCSKGKGDKSVIYNVYLCIKIFLFQKLQS